MPFSCSNGLAEIARKAIKKTNLTHCEKMVCESIIMTIGGVEINFKEIIIIRDCTYNVCVVTDIPGISFHVYGPGMDMSFHGMYQIGNRVIYKAIQVEYFRR